MSALSRRALVASACLALAVPAAAHALPIGNGPPPPSVLAERADWCAHSPTTAQEAR